MNDFQTRYAAMSADEKRAMWDSHHGFDREWGLFTCSDCDPEWAEEPAEHAEKFSLVCRVDQRPDYCPRCLSYLSLGDPTAVRVTTVLAVDE